MNGHFGDGVEEADHFRVDIKLDNRPNIVIDLPICADMDNFMTIDIHMQNGIGALHFCGVYLTNQFALIAQEG